MRGITPIALKIEVSICGQMYGDKETWVVVNKSVNEFYTWLPFKIDALPQGAAFPLDNAAILFNNLIPGVRELLR